MTAIWKTSAPTPSRVPPSRRLDYSAASAAGREARRVARTDGISISASTPRKPPADKERVPEEMRAERDGGADRKIDGAECQGHDGRDQGHAAQKGRTPGIGVGLRDQCDAGENDHGRKRDPALNRNAEDRPVPIFARETEATEEQGEKQRRPNIGPKTPRPEEDHREEKKEAGLHFKEQRVTIAKAMPNPASDTGGNEQGAQDIQIDGARRPFDHKIKRRQAEHHDHAVRDRVHRLDRKAGRGGRHGLAIDGSERERRHGRVAAAEAPLIIRVLARPGNGSSPECQRKTAWPDFTANRLYPLPGGARKSGMGNIRRPPKSGSADDRRSKRRKRRALPG